jgi:DNA-binding SARP family transcriptional activator
MLRISVLGAPQIEIDGQRIATFESRTADALLYYLAVNDRTHTRESLAEFFWPERTQIQSLSNLRTVLHRLRRVLEPHLQITRSTVKLENQAGVWIDAAHLLEVLNEIDVNALVATTAARLNEALVHYRGPMLDGFFLRDCPDFEDWLRRTRETWQIRMVDALDALTAYYLQNEMVVPAMTQVERLIQTDPLREQSYGLKMRLLSGMGQQDKAMDLYRSFEAILHSELDDVPSPELQRLFRQIHASQSTHNGIQRLTLNLAAMTQHWLDADRHRDYLATGKVLQHLETLLDGRVGLSELEREFINASLKIRERLLTEEQTKQNRENALRLVLEATQILDRGGTGELAALLAIQSLELSYTASGDAALLRALQKPLLRQRFSGHNFRTIYITASADGRYLLTAGADKTVRLWETHTGANLRVISDFDVQ